MGRLPISFNSGAARTEAIPISPAGNCAGFGAWTSAVCGSGQLLAGTSPVVGHIPVAGAVLHCSPVLYLPGSGQLSRLGEAARAGSRNGRIYVGNLPADVREKELEELFHRYGRIRSVELKNRGRCSSSPFAFIKFQDPRDAEDAVFGRNGYDFGSCRLRVEFPRPFRGSRGDGGGYGAPRGRNGPPSRRSDFRVLVSGLPPSGSWQDLKDHMRKAGDVCYADVHKDGMGIVEFIRKEDMEYALRKLDDTKFRSHEGENYYIRVCPERNASYSRSRSRSRGRDSTYQSRRSPSPFRPY
ncbi:serine/arginine-rich splicing factor 9-like [Discoglossus pictus]